MLDDHELCCKPMWLCTVISVFSFSGVKGHERFPECQQQVLSLCFTLEASERVSRWRKWRILYPEAYGLTNWGLYFQAGNFSKFLAHASPRGPSHLCAIASTPGPTEFVGPGSRCLILHGWSLGNAIAQKHHYDNAHKQLTVCCRSQELLLSTTGSCQHLFQMLGSLHGDGTDSAR